MAHIVINVGGSRFYLFKSQLNRQPDSRLTDLGSLSSNFRSGLNEYYFDRNPRAFKAIANYYKTGKLHLPGVRKNLKYFKIAEIIIFSDSYGLLYWLKTGFHLKFCEFLYAICKR